MQIVLYRMTDDEKTFPKHFEMQTTVNGVLRSETDFTNPVFRVEMGINAPYNYCYIPAFSRYYFLSAPVTIRTGLIEYSGRVDVLQSFYNQFKKCPVIVSRSDSDYNTFIPDNNRKFYQYESHEYADIGRISFEDDTEIFGNIDFVVVTVG